MPPTTASLISALPASTAPDGPNTRFRPDTGLSFEKVGLNGVRVRFRRTCATFASRPASPAASTTGAIAFANAPMPHETSDPIPAAVASCGFPACASPRETTASSCESMCGPPITSAAKPAARPAVEFSSCERATWPFLRASPLRFGVAFSVRPSRSPAMAAQVVAATGSPVPGHGLVGPGCRGEPERPGRAGARNRTREIAAATI